jgi:hypothetical protein
MISRTWIPGAALQVHDAVAVARVLQEGVQPMYVREEGKKGRKEGGL